MAIKIDKAIHRDYLKNNLRHFEKYLLWDEEDRGGTNVLIPRYYKLTDWKSNTKYWIGECVIYEDCVYEAIEDVDDTQTDFPIDSFKLIQEKNHFVYVDEFEIDAGTTDWNELAPCKVGQIYSLKSEMDKPRKIYDEVFNTGDFIIIMNDVEVDDSGTPTEDVKVKKLGSGDKSFLVVGALPTIDIQEEAIYELKTIEQKDVAYYAMPQSEIDAGSTFDTDGITIKSDNTQYTYEEIANHINDFVTTYNFVEVTKEDANSNTLVYYTIKGIKYSECFETFEELPCIELYVYDTVKAEWNKFYPIDGITNPVTVEYITQHVYDVITGIEEDPDIVMTYSEYSFYVITDAELPTVYLHGYNLYSNEALISVDKLPTEDIIEDSFYKVSFDTVKDVKHYGLTQAQIDLGATIDKAGVTIIVSPVTGSKLYTYDEIAANPDTFLGLGYVEETIMPSSTTFGIYKDNDDNVFANLSTEIKNKGITEVHFRHNGEWHKIYSSDIIQVAKIELTQEEYDQLIATDEIDPNTIYWITDKDKTAYLNKENLLGAGGIIEVEELPSDIDNIDVKCIYKLISTEKEQVETNLEYYNVTKYIVDPTGIIKAPGELITWAELAADKDQYIEDLELEPCSSTETGNQIILFYEDGDGNKQAIQKNQFTPTFVDTLKYELYFYSAEEDKWIIIYPSAIEFEDKDIDFNDDTEWYPEKM